MDTEDVARLRSVINKLSRQFNVSATDEGLTPAQASALALVASRGPLTLPELTSMEGLNPSMVSRVIGHLDEAGLVRRGQNPDDLRSGVVEITAMGLTMHERIKLARGAVVSDYLNQLSEGDRDAITGVLPALEALAMKFSREPQQSPSARQ